MQDIRQDFWSYNQRLLKLDSDNRVYFTKAGRSEYGPLLARHGFDIQGIRTLEQLRNAMRQVNASELDANTRKLQATLDDPSLADEDRALIRRLLGADAPVEASPARSLAPVVDLAAFRLARSVAPSDGVRARE